MSRRTGRAQPLEFSARHEVESGTFCDRTASCGWRGAAAANR